MDEDVDVFGKRWCLGCVVFKEKEGDVVFKVLVVSGEFKRIVKDVE